MDIMITEFEFQSSLGATKGRAPDQGFHGGALTQSRSSSKSWTVPRLVLPARYSARVFTAFTAISSRRRAILELLTQRASRRSTVRSIRVCNSFVVMSATRGARLRFSESAISAPGGTRTPNTQFRRLMLYPLSYRRKVNEPIDQ